MDGALITGGASVIAIAIAEELAATGAEVILADRDVEGARAAAAQVDGARAVELDLRSPASVREVADEVLARGDLRYLVNAGSVYTDGDFEQVDESLWSRDLDVVLGGAFRLCQAVLPSMRAAGRGAVVNVASVNGHRYFGGEMYGAAKAGLLNLTRALAVQYGPYGVRVNSVSPGSIVTPAREALDRTVPGSMERAARWYPLGRLGTPQDVASAVAFLLSDRASWITGIDLPVEGGVMAGYRGFVDDVGGAVVGGAVDGGAVDGGDERP